MAERVDLARRHREGALDRERALGHHDDRGEALPRLVAVLDDPADLVDVERPLGHQHHRRPAGDAGPGGDVARVAAHDLDDHDPVVRLGRGVQPVDGVDAHLHGGVEPEGHLGGGQVVVDGLGHPDHGQALGGQPRRDAERVLAADRHQGVDAVVGQRGPDGVGPPVDLVGVGPRRAEDRAAPREGAAERLDAEVDDLVLDRAAPPVTDADHLVAVDLLALADHRPHHRVEPGAVAALRSASPPSWARRYRACRRP